MVKLINRFGIILGAIVLFSLAIFSTYNVLAEDKTVQIWDYELDERIEHRSIKVGNKNERFDVKLPPDSLLAESYNWKSSNSNIALIENEKTNNPIIHGVKEGTAKISLEVKTKDGNTYSDETIVSVYTPIGDISGKLRDKATLYRGADNKSWVRTESENKKPSVVIKGSCGNFYYVELPENYKFDDNRSQRLAYVNKNKVDIPATGIKLDTNELILKQGGVHQFKATIIPDIATDVTEKDIVWKKVGDKISLDNKGKVQGLKTGCNYVEVSLDKRFKDKCSVIVTAEIEENYLSDFQLSLDKEYKDKVTLHLGKCIGANEHHIEMTENGKRTIVYESYGEDVYENTKIDIVNLKLGQTYFFRGIAKNIQLKEDEKTDYKELNRRYSNTITIKLGGKSPKIYKLKNKGKYVLIKWKEPDNCKKFTKYKGKNVKYGLYRKVGNGKYKHIKTTKKLEWEDSKVKDGKVYCYRVKRKYTKKNCSDYSKEKSIIRPLTKKKKKSNKKKK